jgi:elongation factor G
VAVVGHSGAGKTQLISAALVDAGAVNRFGKVDEGTTVTDYDEEAIARHHTLAASLAYLEVDKQKINLIDTPGMGNFLTDARAALRVAEAALVVVDAVSGPHVSTEKVWETAEELQLPRLIVCTGSTAIARASTRAVESMQATLGRNCVPVQLPIGEEKDFKGVIDLVAMKAYTFAGDESGKMTEAPCPTRWRMPRRRRATR